MIGLIVATLLLGGTIFREGVWSKRVAVAVLMVFAGVVLVGQ